MQAIKTPGTIWARLIEQNNTNNKKPDGRGDAFCYFVGNRSSGKSTLLNRFLYPARAEIPKPSEGLDYTYARKPSQYDHERKDLAHIWEIAGSQEFAEEISQGDQVFLNVKQVTSATVVVTLDLSDPGTVLSSAIYWLDQIKKKLAATYDKFEKKGLQLPEQLRARARSKLYTNNDDKDVVYHSGIAIVLAATKYDTFKNADPEIKKVVARSLRYLAHSNGAYLVYLGGLEGAGDAGRDGMQEKLMLDNFSRLMNHLIFIGLEKKPPLKVPPQTDHTSLIMMPAGSDTLADIGRPRGAADANLAAGLAEWQELYDKMFPQKADKAKERARKFVIDDRYKEEEVDKLRVRKMEELANYVKEQAAAEEARKKKIAAAKAKASSKSSDKKASSSKSGDKEKPKKSKLAVAS